MDMDRLQKSDHEDFKLLLSILEETNEEDKVKNLVLNKLKMGVLAHRMAEEEVFFAPLLSKASDLRETIDKTKQEHKLIEDLFNELSTIKANDHNWHPTLDRLRKVLESDISKEEEKMLPHWKKTFSDKESINFAKEMIIKKMEFEESFLDRLGHRIKEKMEQIGEMPSKIVEKIS